MHRKVTIAGMEPRGLTQLPHSLQAEKSISLHAPATLTAEQAAKNICNGVNVRGDIQSPPQQVVASIDHQSDFFGRDHLSQTLDEICSARAAGEHTDHAALSSLARPSVSQAAASFSVSSPGLDIAAGKNSG